ncbi:hypothetical protein F4825DRAFT_466152 [Nemania diffusa]|nr:hypothetical protein F4825DRAFT_466152 [Nemania diffusa]
MCKSSVCAARILATIIYIITAYSFVMPTQANNALTLSFVNNHVKDPVTVYVSGRDSRDSIVFLTSNGTWHYPSPCQSTKPQPTNTTVTVPEYINAGRIWVAVGELQFYILSNEGRAQSLIEPSVSNPDDPSAEVSWGFVEFTNTPELGLYANLSFVDFVGLPLGISLVTRDGAVQTVAGLPKGAVSDICQEIRLQAANNSLPWDSLCISSHDNRPLRILSPNTYASTHLGLMQGYYALYVKQVWKTYTSQDLLIDTQSDTGLVSCRVKDDILHCEGDNRGYARPDEADTWGCNTGPFMISEGDNGIHQAIVPRLCAAFTRSTLLIEGGSIQPSVESNAYYSSHPTNYYSRIIHEFLADGKGYTFPYDDVSASEENTAGVVSGFTPKLLNIFVG